MRIIFKEERLESRKSWLFLAISILISAYLLYITKAFPIVLLIVEAMLIGVSFTIIVLSLLIGENLFSHFIFNMKRKFR